MLFFVCSQIFFAYFVLCTKRLKGCERPPCRGRMVVGHTSTSTYGIRAFHRQILLVSSCSRGVIVEIWWLLQDTPVYFANRIDRHEINKTILLLYTNIKNSPIISVLLKLNIK